jgi:hypothetical protein
VRDYSLRRFASSHYYGGTSFAKTPATENPGNTIEVQRTKAGEQPGYKWACETAQVQGTIVTEEWTHNKMDFKFSESLAWMGQ